MIEKTLDNYNLYLMDLAQDAWNGSKFEGSFGPITDFAFVDYWTLRKRSLRLFKENLYAKGIIRRLIWNEIHTGLVAAPMPVGSVIWSKKSEDEQEEKATDYAEKFSTEFDLYASTPAVFDWGKKQNFGAFQEQVRFESLVCGDGIIISRIDNKTGLPRWQWVNGDNIRTPDNYTPKGGNWIKHGVEFDKYGKKVAFHIRTEINGDVHFERVPTRGEKSGRLISWMVYGSETLLDDTRGEPFLADTLYMLKELDRYRDAETRAAVINAMLAFFVERSQESAKGARPSDGLARLRPTVGTTPAEPKDYNPFPDKKIGDDLREMKPGTFFDDLDPGQKIVSPATNRPNVNYRIFEEAIISGLAWTHGIPPEILMLKFGNNYSASRQANNEFEVYLSRQIKKNADAFCQNIYNAFITQAILQGQLDAPGFLQAYGDVTKWRVVSAWLQCTWLGLSRPSVDREKEIRASQLAVDNGFSTFDKEALRNSGMTLKQVLRQQKKERALMQRTGFIPHVDENNNGEPAYTDIDAESINDESELNGSSSPSSERRHRGQRMNGMEDLIIKEPEDKALEQMEKQQLVSVIIDQQKELNRMRGLLELEKKNSERFRSGYYTLAHFDWMITNERLQKEWRDAKVTPPNDSSMKWVCSEGGVEVPAFYDGENWWTEKHEKVNAMVWQHLPHYSETAEKEILKNG